MRFFYHSGALAVEGTAEGGKVHQEKPPMITETSLRPDYR
jgi:hypothetical protein